MQAGGQSAISTARRGAVAIGHDALHAWYVDLDAPGAAAAATLDSAERARAASYLRPQDGLRFAASRAALRLVLAGYLDAAPADLQYRIGPRGRPHVAGDEVWFSLARSDGVALIAVSRMPVGADVERVQPRPGLTDLAAARFTPREAAGIAAGCCGPALQSFYRHWTVKEAYLKAVGLGVPGLRDVELACSARPTLYLARRPVDGWSLSAVNAPAGYVAAIVGRMPVTSWQRLSPGRAATPAKPAGSCP